MDCCKGQSKKRHFSASSFLGQDRHMKEECSFTFSHPGLSSNNGVFLSSRPFLLLYIFRWCFSPSCCSRGSGCWWGDSWGNPSEAAFQIISHDLDIKLFLLIQNIDLLAPISACILVVIGEVWEAGIFDRSPDFTLSHPFSQEKLLAIITFALRAHMSNVQPRLQQKKQKVNFSKSIITKSSQAL